MTDNRNVQDKYKSWHLDLIKDDLESNSFPFAVLMEHLNGDFNIGTVVRNANAFGAEKLFYIGKKKWDRRGAVGAHHYTMVDFISQEQLTDLQKEYTFVALENKNATSLLSDFTWPAKPLIIIGEEGSGISDKLLSLCEHVVEIPQFGSVRSLNAGTASGVAMYDYTSKVSK